VAAWCQGYIYEVQALRKWDPQTQCYHYVVGLSDFHDKQHPATKPQRGYIEALIKNCDTKKTAVLLEDLSSPNWYGEQKCGSFRVDSRGGLLGGLSDVCKQHKVAVDNVEYRYCRVAAFGPVLNNARTRLDSFQSTRAIPMQAIAQEIVRQLRQIEEYNDHPTLNKQYIAHVARIKALMQKFHISEHPQMSAVDYLESHTKEAKREQALKMLLVFDSMLLDFHLVHAVLKTQQQKDTVLAIAGGSHIKNMAALLQKVGYEPVHVSTIVYEKESDPSMCTQMPVVNGSYCVKPQAVDLRVVEQFFK